MKNFKIKASYTTYVYAIVEAENEQKAYELAQDMDGGDFIQERTDGLGNWYIDDIEEIEE